MVLLLIFTICILLSIFLMNKLINYETFVSNVEEIEDVELEEKDTENSFQNNSGNISVNTDKELVDSDTLVLVDERRKQGELFSQAIENISKKINSANVSNKYSNQFETVATSSVNKGLDTMPNNDENLSNKDFSQFSLNNYDNTSDSNNEMTYNVNNNSETSELHRGENPSQSSDTITIVNQLPIDDTSKLDKSIPDKQDENVESVLNEIPVIETKHYYPSLGKPEIVNLEQINMNQTEQVNIEDYIHKKYIPDMSKYILKTEIPARPDMDKYVLRSTIQACPKPTDMSQYVKKTCIKPNKCPDMDKYVLKTSVPPCDTKDNVEINQENNEINLPGDDIDIKDDKINLPGDEINLQDNEISNLKSSLSEDVTGKKCNKLLQNLNDKTEAINNNIQIYKQELLNQKLELNKIHKKEKIKKMKDKQALENKNCKLIHRIVKHADVYGPY